MGPFGAGELIIIAVLVIVIFGGRKLPELGKGLGQGLANFRQAVREPQKASPPAEAEPAEGRAAKSDPAGKTDHPA